MNAGSSTSLSKAATSTHGGARRHGEEQSEALTLRQCQMILDAAETARALGSPFNRFITILWEHGGLKGRSATRATGRFIKLASDWMRLRGERLRWAYVHENGRRKGIHVHLFIHVPPRLDQEFRGMPRTWVRSILGGRYVTKTLLSKKVAGANTPDAVSGATYEHLLRIRLHYVLKSAHPDLLNALSMHDWGRVRWGRGGTIFGKRTGRWQERR